MRIVSFNANGMRSALRKDWASAVAAIGGDLWCIQETRAPQALLETIATEHGFAHHVHHIADKAGYSGASIFSTREADEVLIGCGIDWIDFEGRCVAMRFADTWVVSFYFPSGSSGEPRQHFKYRLLDAVTPWLEKLRRKNRQVILCGDLNIAHKAVDIRNAKGNAKNSGFLPLERGWLNYLFDQLGWVDSFRTREQPEHRYTWWSNRGQARANNVGWRLDYQIATPEIAASIVDMGIYTEQALSDHAPYWVDYQWPTLA